MLGGKRRTFDPEHKGKAGWLVVAIGRPVAVLGRKLGVVKQTPGNCVKAYRPVARPATRLRARPNGPRWRGCPVPSAQIMRSSSATRYCGGNRFDPQCSHLFGATCSAFEESACTTRSLIRRRMSR